MAAIYPSHRYGVPRSGTPESVARLDEKVARALYESYFVPNNAILSISGDVDASAFIARMRKALADWSPSDVPEQTPPPPIEALATPRIVIVDEPDLVQARIVITHEGIARTDPRRVAAGLMNDTLGGSGFSSRMMKTLRSNEGLTYGVGSGFALRRQPGPFIVSTFTRVAETRRAVNILLGEIEGILGDHAQTADELTKAKSYNVGQFGLGLETSAAVLGALVDLELHGLPENSLDTYRARVDAVTLEEVDEIARALLHPGRAAIVLLGPAADLVPQFEDLGEIQVVEP
jgi:zinc protease